MFDIKKINNIYCVGLNYYKHAQEMGRDCPSEPMIFLKNNSSVRKFKSSPIAFSNEIFDYEAEIVLVIKNHLLLNSKAVKSDIKAVGIGIDLTRRSLQSSLKEKGHPWTVSKNFKGSALLSSFCDDIEELDLENIDFEFSLNEEKKQFGHSKNMMFSCIQIINYLLKHNDLYPHDVIFTGTPEGVGKIKVGDTFIVRSHCLNIHETGVL